MTDHDPLDRRMHDDMRDAVADVSADPDLLVRSARRQGTGLRRRRQATVVLGSVAAVMAVGFGGYLATTGGDDRAPADQASDVPAAGQPAEQPASKQTNASSSQPVPLTGRSTVAGLQEAIEGLAKGTFSDFAGQGDSQGEFKDTYGELFFTPADGSGRGQVGINVQDGSILDEGKGIDFTCGQSFMNDCAVVRLPNGDQVRTYQDPSDGAGDIRLVAELLTKDQSLRLVASATNGEDLGGNEWNITRDTAVLDRDQLTEIVTQDYWGFSVPQRLKTAGDALAPYEDYDAVDDGGLSPTPEG